MVLRFVAFSLLSPVMMFLSSGDWGWGWGWALSITVVVLNLASRAIVWQRNPSLLLERGERGVTGEDAKPWDRVMAPIVGLIGPVVIWVTAGLDHRSGWSGDVADAVQVLALVLVGLTYVMGTWAMVVNPFLSGVVRIQTERGHSAVDTGPYRYVRHPSYLAMLVCYVAVPLALSSLWALVPAALTAGVLIARTALEDRALVAELKGYRRYTERVRYRLVPGVW
jgi:protein-S-isoprenylcysteine O-methyltransferase Ste14